MGGNATLDRRLDRLSGQASNNLSILARHPVRQNYKDKLYKQTVAKAIIFSIFKNCG